MPVNFIEDSNDWNRKQVYFSYNLTGSFQIKLLNLSIVSDAKTGPSDFSKINTSFLNCQKANFSDFSNIYVGKYSCLVFHLKDLIHCHWWEAEIQTGLWLRVRGELGLRIYFQGSRAESAGVPGMTRMRNVQGERWASLLAKGLGSAAFLTRAPWMVMVEPWSSLPSEMSPLFPWQWFFTFVLGRIAAACISWPPSLGFLLERWPYNCNSQSV